MELKQIFFGLSGYPSDGKGMRTVVFLLAVPCAVPGVRHRSHSRGREVYYMKEPLHRMRRLHPGLFEQALRRSEKRERSEGITAVNSAFSVDACNYRAQQIYGKEMTVKRGNARDPEG